MQFKTIKAIELAGSAKDLATLFGVTQSAVSQWAEDLPQARVWQLMALRPYWFSQEESKSPNVPQTTNQQPAGQGA